MPQRQSKTHSLTPKQAEFIQSCVETGRYQSSSEVVRAALRLLQDREAHREAELERIRSAVEVGLDELDRGEWFSAEEVFKELLASDGQDEGQGPAA